MKILLGVVAAVLALAGIVWLFDNYSGVARQTYIRRRYPPVKAPSKLGAEIGQRAEARRYERFDREYRRVLGLLEEASRKGHDVRRLSGKMRYAARLAREGKYEFADIHLNTIEVRIPRRRESLRPAAVDDERDIFPVPEGRPYRGSGSGGG
ncbi:MAG: hypothetical protein ABII00_15150 [Elusimicrobiota bacterium]